MVESVVIPRVIEFIVNDFNHYLSQHCRCFRTGKETDILEPTTLVGWRSPATIWSSKKGKKGASTAPPACFLLASTTEVCGIKVHVDKHCVRLASEMGMQNSETHPRFPLSFMNLMSHLITSLRQWPVQTVVQIPTSEYACMRWLS